MSSPIRPPFTEETAILKVQAAEDAWNSLRSSNGSLLLTPKIQNGAIAANFYVAGPRSKRFLSASGRRRLDYRLKKELWAFRDNRIAVRFEYEWHDSEGHWYRSYGNEMWEFDDSGLMRKRYASINDVSIQDADRRLRLTV